MSNRPQNRGGEPSKSGREATEQTDAYDLAYPIVNPPPALRYNEERLAAENRTLRNYGITTQETIERLAAKLRDANDNTKRYADLYMDRCQKWEERGERIASLMEECERLRKALNGAPIVSKFHGLRFDVDGFLSAYSTWRDAACSVPRSEDK